MCGFAGFLTFGSPRADGAQRRSLLIAMGNAIAHRGPDDAQYFDDGTLALAFRRLSIVDVLGGRQPIHNETGTALIAANAEIYNHTALRRELQSRHHFSSQSDCEVALHAFEEWGESAIERLNGMFAIALWDSQTRKLVLARDRLGIKPLYVCRLADGLLFGSELKALLAHPQCPRALDWKALDRTAIFQSPKTSYVLGVELLPAGEILTATGDGVMRQRRYWSINDHLGTAPHGADTAAYSEAYADLLEQVTHEHLQRDVDGALHLSGGLDSSLMAALIARKEKAFPCFTLVGRTTLLGGDADSARRLTQALSLPWYPVHCDHRSVVEDMNFDLGRFEQSIWMMDSPRFDLEWFFKEELHRVAKFNFPGLKVLILGQGADEFAGGYSRRLDASHPNWAQYLRDEIVPNLLLDSALEHGGARHLWPLMSEPAIDRGQIGPYHRIMPLFCRQLEHHNLWHEDRTSSWNGLEARVPFLDHRLVELLASVPTELHPTLFWDKKIVRDAMRRFLPNHEFTQPKIGFWDGKDNSAQDVIVHTMVKRIAGSFRDKYLDGSGSLFEPRRIDTLIARVINRGPTFQQDSKQLMECMAIAIFDKQCREGQAATRTPVHRETVLPIAVPSDWDRLESAMAPPPVCSSVWAQDESVRLREGIEIVVPLRTGLNERFVFVLNDAVAGQMEVAGKHPWLGVFLRNIGRGSAAAFTVQDWVDEFEVAIDEFRSVLSILAHQGVVVAPEAVAWIRRAEDGPSVGTLAVADPQPIQIPRTGVRNANAADPPGRPSRTMAVRDCARIA